jgi:transcription-repair coupling factor (superfamily II helicase)
MTALAEKNWHILVVTPPVLLEFLDGEALEEHTAICLRTGQTLDTKQLLDTLTQLGYQRVDLVDTPGDFAARGFIIDVFPPFLDHPVRIERFDDQIEEIRFFDPQTQRSLKPLQELMLRSPGRQSLSANAFARFSQKGSQRWSSSPQRPHFIQLIADLQARQQFPGHEHWQGFFSGNPRPLSGCLGSSFDLLIDHPDPCLQELQQVWVRFEQQKKEAQKEHRIHAEAEELLACQGQQLLWPQPPNRILLLNDDQGPPEAPLPLKSLTEGSRGLERLFHTFGQHRCKELHFYCRTPHRRAMFQETFDQAIDASREDTRATLCLHEGELSTGFLWPRRRLLMLDEKDLWPSGSIQPRRRRAERSWVIHFNEEDLVLHQEHGVGRYRGLVEVNTGGKTYEMMLLEYAEGAKLYVSLQNLHLIERLDGDAQQQKVDFLGSGRWLRTKTKAREEIVAFAKELLATQAQRSVASMTPLKSSAFLQEFDDDFEFEPTPDQKQAFLEIERDLSSGQPMDRLLVGDVGFGKTEVAFRFLFQLMIEGHQGAILCPTTVLTFQHFLNAQRRFQAFPVTIAMLSRLQTARESKKIINDLADGRIDLIIGTHKLLNDAIRFRRLGGLVLDEEQRFGVQHKQKLLQLRADTHVLSMSATPIPRTLNLSLKGLKRLSLIQTPPQNRLAITTTVAPQDDYLLKSAIEFELMRHGQIYCIQNDIDQLPELAAKIQALVPGLRVGIAHGRCAAKEIEQTMMAFFHHQIDALIATTIVENGVDLPNANTLIVFDADHFGLSTLYQLRGRIGRSSAAGYAYFFTQAKGKPSPNAKKRLAALEEFSHLGAGFELAALDLELRGAGDLLGKKQSGHLHTIGLSLYSKLLQEAMRELQGQPRTLTLQPVLALNLGAALSKEMVESPSLRLSLYKRFSGMDSQEELNAFVAELRDTLGRADEPLLRLIREQKLKLLAKEAGLEAVEREGRQLKLRFHPRCFPGVTVFERFHQHNLTFSFDRYQNCLVKNLPPATEANRFYDAVQHILKLLTKS